MAGDPALAVLIGVGGSLAGVLYRPAGWAPFDAWACGLTWLTALPLAVRRPAPAAVLVTSCAAYAAYLSLGYVPSLNWWAMVVALVNVAAWRPSRIAVPAAALTVATLLYSGVVGRLPLLLSCMQALLIAPVAYLIGRAGRRAAERNVRLRVLARQLAEEQQAREQRAVMDERVRIARELHDVVAHHMSVISVQAGLAEYIFDSAPETARTAVGSIGTASREALSDLRRLLTVLRDDRDERDAGRTDAGHADVPRAMPELRNVGELAERIGMTGVTVTVETLGRPRQLAPGLELCAYRVVQEALTNVVKHAGPARAEVVVHYRPEELRITVRDDGGRGHPVLSATGTGHGLINMRERARVCGGTLSAGARPGGGYEVVLTLPLSSGA
ncbi:two-component system sensor kinase (plasmid) [Streptantibioticus cattleyicolor NRRL 8057 = DSM 46488]|uniref:histidine kinase n=1 Tax=Streptantibioticus cattleyicolor (strain ATCC 35852 / DSM 46488 / JCM 4925 / NBRC 14057 / NRRL 8057) TaxID=1003195 RepID=G8XFZ5_STREN|nr:two-component system sensor kinase [Streptantibioticus cattleyicolor NRRL 8057 = DSM 46488]